MEELNLEDLNFDKDSIQLFDEPLEDLDKSISEAKSSEEKDATFFRLCLYWLERFKRIELGMYALAQYPIELTQKRFDNTTFESDEDKNTRV